MIESFKYINKILYINYVSKLKTNNYYIISLLLNIYI